VNGRWWFEDIIMRGKLKLKSEFFPEISIQPGQPKSELIMNPFMIGKYLNNQIIHEFLEDVINSDPSADISVVNQESTKITIDYLWDMY
jgi:hypothetical protein